MRFSELLTHVLSKEIPTEKERFDLLTQAQRLEAQAWESEELATNIASSGFLFLRHVAYAGQRNIKFDKNGISLVGGSAATNRLDWLTDIRGTNVARIFTSVVGSSPNRYGLLIIRAEPETGANTSAQGWVAIEAYDHDGSGDDVKRGVIQVVAGTADIEMYDTSEVAVGKTHWSQSEVAFNETAKDYDTRIEGQTDPNLIVADASEDNVGIGTATPNTSAKLEINSTTGAVLLPRMTTTQRNALTATNGMVLYNTTTNQMEGYINGAWAAM